MPAVGEVLMRREGLVIREMLGTRVVNILPQCGQWFDDMDVIDIGRAEGYQIGRGGLIKKRFMGAISGVVESGANYGHRGLYGEGVTNLGSAAFYLHSLATGSPNPRLSPVPRAYGMAMELFSFEFTVPLTLGQLTLEALPAVIKEQIAPIFDGTAKNIALYAGVHFFTNREAGNRLSTMDSPALDNAATAKTLTFQSRERVACRFVDGQSVDIYTSTNTRVNERNGERIPCWVRSVDHMLNVIVIQIEPGEDLSAPPWNVSLTNGYVTWANDNTGMPGHLRTPYGWRDWIKVGGPTDAENRLLGSAAITTTPDDVGQGTDNFIDIRQRPWARSWTRHNVGTLTQQDLELYLDEAILALKNYGFEIDTIIFSRGVRHAMWQLDLARSYLVNQRPSTQTDYGLKGGFAITTPSGGTLRGYQSPMLEDGLVLGLKLRNNWKIITVPNPQGASASEDRMLPKEGLGRRIPVYFKGTLLGFPSPKVPVMSANSEFLNAVHFPGVGRYNIVEDSQIPGVLLSGVQTVRAFSVPPS